MRKTIHLIRPSNATSDDVLTTATEMTGVSGAGESDDTVIEIDGYFVMIADYVI